MPSIIIGIVPSILLFEFIELKDIMLWLRDGDGRDGGRLFVAAFN